MIIMGSTNLFLIYAFSFIKDTTIVVFIFMDNTIKSIFNFADGIQGYMATNLSTYYLKRNTPVVAGTLDQADLERYVNSFKTSSEIAGLIIVLILAWSLDKIALIMTYSKPETILHLKDLFLNNSFFYFYFFYIALMTFITILVYFLGVKGVYSSAVIGIFLFWVSQLFVFNYVIMHSGVTSFSSFVEVPVYGSIKFNIALTINYVTFSFLFLTTTIGFFAVVYSLVYFKNEPHADRFVILLNWFIISMALLVVADNALLLYLGWELIGLTSFFLINFWSLRRGTMKASFKAFVFNKFSDLFLLIFIAYMVLITKTQSIVVWLTFFELLSPNFTNLNTALLFLLIAASIKSAQIIGHLWLPDSMEAPIPASALIHSATLVSAGVFLLLRFQNILVNSYVFPFIGILGSITAVYGALVSSAQTDVKKLLAYSTISHCGFLFVTVYLNNINLTLLYLYLHGFFKALTFFCVGNLVKLARGSQDTRKMGSLYSLVPLDSALLVFCSINLGGLPLTVGFYFKHVFQALIGTTKLYLLFTPFLILAMLCGFIYSFRLIFYSLFDIKKGPEYIYLQFNKNTMFEIQSHKFYTNSNLLSLVNFVILLTITYTYYFNFSFYASNHNVEFNTSQSLVVSDFLNMSTERYNNFYINSLLFVFYTLFVAVLFIINTITTRKVFSDVPVAIFLVYCIIFVLTLSTLSAVVYDYTVIIKPLLGLFFFAIGLQFIFIKMFKKFSKNSNKNFKYIKLTIWFKKIKEYLKEYLKK